MTACNVSESGTVELYFYGELEPAERQSFEQHLTTCRACCVALDELTTIRDVLAARPDVCAPPAGDWSGFTARLNRAIRQHGLAPQSTVVNLAAPNLVRRSYAPWIATAALLALVTMSLFFVARSREDAGVTAGDRAGGVDVADTSVIDAPAADPALAALTGEHFERSKLVVLGLATKDAHAPEHDWNYERKLASALLNDTRLYRLAAEERGMNRLAGVLRDLELVLLQTSLTESADPDALEQIQRLIRKRDLVGKMEVVSTTGI